ncbi:endonuclease/exonuclease/phosphatase family protein [Lewinella sp. 4G2]|uniref:endonuclease/exonuclease/phosphatase family protein n=1 Tax=Lewinella sp. 4G2 TaxID=1803372 RepID=UPI0007B4DD7C|nr:endonuclease/exonuclease/phosphatase family protein [Lewinella sp. 4G2]OAV43736.1 hypothetical protein A3850_004155 [Lewinella sp. 4G2]
MFRFLFHLLGYGTAFLAGCGLLARFIPPDQLWPPAIIALMLPVLLLFTLIYAGILVYRKDWRKLVFPLVILVFALPLVPQLFSFGGGTKSAKGEPTIRVLTTNVRLFRNDAWKKISADRSLSFAKSYDPDVLMVQESSRFANTKAERSYIKQHLGLGDYYQPTGKTAVTFASGLKKISSHYTPKAYNGFTVVDVDTELGKVRVINAHLQSNQISKLADRIGNDKDLDQTVNRAKSMLRSYATAAAKRAQQAEEIQAIVNASPHPVILGGDFNDVPSSYTYRKALSPRLRDAWAEAGTGLGTTFTGPIPWLRIDYLMVDTAFTIHSVERVETGYSDHRGLGVVLGL